MPGRHTHAAAGSAAVTQTLIDGTNSFRAFGVWTFGVVILWQVRVRMHHPDPYIPTPTTKSCES